MQYIDLTHEFKVPMPVYPGDRSPEVVQVTTVEREGYATTHTTASMHVGTHIDAPAHMIAGGKCLSEYPPEHFCGRGVLIDARGVVEVGPELLTDIDLRQGDIVLVMTGFSSQYREQTYFDAYPVMTERCAEVLVRTGVHIVGFDSPSPDGPPFSVHKILLAKDVLIIENLLNLEQLLGVESFTVSALPPKFYSDGAPVRVVASV